MAVDKSRLRPILEGQSGRTVATNIKSSLDYLADEIDKKGEAGTGSTDYSQLTGKPSINGVELNGSKTSAQLDIPTRAEVNGKQPKLISGTNIKTVNGESILGEGNIPLPSSGGGGIGEAPSDGNQYTRGNKTWKKLDISGKQDQLISGVNIKTVNGEDILGSGDLKIKTEGGGGSKTNVVDNLVSNSATDALSARQGRVLKQELDNKQPKGFYLTSADIESKAEKVKVESGGSGYVTKQLKPNTFYEFGQVSQISITFAPEIVGIYNSYSFQFKSGSSTSLVMPSSVKWDGNEAPKISPNKTYQISVVNNLGVWGEF